MEKDYDLWNTQKKQINQQVTSGQAFFAEREVWLCSIGLNIGVESNGKREMFTRPVLLLRVFNRDMVWIVPMTSTVKDSRFNYKIFFNKEIRSIMLTQLRVISTKRLYRKVDVVSEFDFSKIKSRIISLLKSETPQ